MRPKPALLCLLSLAFVGGIGLVGPIQPQGQETANQEEPRRPTTSLELGGVYDQSAQQAFEAALSPTEREALIKLVSRSVLADPACPMPVPEPTAPFYIKFRSPLDAPFAARLQAAGVSFIGYAAENAHFVRTVDAAAQPGVRALLETNTNVVGTALQRTEDKCDAKAWQLLQDLSFEGADFRILFWKDVQPQAALELLAAFDAPILEASTDAGGTFDLETPFIDTRLDRTALLAFAASPLIEWIQPRPVWRTLNTASAALSHASEAEVGPGTSYNLDGNGLVAGVWDGGTGRDTHQASQGAPSPSPINNGTKRIIKTTALGLDGGSTSAHPTHVIGTIMGDGTGNSAARGYAPKVCVASYDWNNMESERRVARNVWRIVADNHSYGNGTSSTYQGSEYGGYDSSAQASDIDIRDILLNMCKSAGNDGDRSGSTGPGDNTCTNDACIKNAFIVGATSDSGNISSFSSRGPTDDGRLIPHVCANGENLLSHGSSNDTSFVQSGWSGTSMSSPSVCGSMVLLSQLFKREMSNRFFSPDVSRAVVALTADDRGNTGPDYRYGFGIVDCKRAADLILADKATAGRHVVHGTIRQGETIDYPLVVTSSATPLRVILSWLDVYASTGAGTKLINDLDLELIAPNGTTINYPWRGLTAAGSQTHQWTRTDANRRDNIELATVDTPAVGTWTVRVRGFNLPANPQSGIPNGAVGFVVACERPLTINKVVREDTLNTGSPVSIPDASATGISRNFSVTGASGTVAAVRVYIDIKHPRRADLRVYLRHPDSTQITIETTTSTRRDLLAILPDTRQNQSDFSTMVGKAVNGTWTVVVADVTGSNTGVVNYLTLEIDVEPAGNNPPNADAGANQSVNEGTTVNLNGTGSSDPDLDTLTFAWTQIGGPTVTLAGAATATPSFTAPQVTVNTDLTFRLTVDDGNGGTDTDDVVVSVLNVTAPNTPPNADAGANFSLTEGTPGALDGTASSDPDLDTLTFSWAQISGPTVTLSGATSATPTFTAPMVTATTALTFRLTVNDGRGGTDTDDIVVTVTDSPVNQPPVANAGVDQNALFNEVITLDASASTDPENDTLMFSWVQIGGTTAITLNTPNSVSTSFTAPAVADTLIFQVEVNDGQGNIAIDTVTVNVSATGGGSSGGNGGGGGKGGGGGCSTDDTQSLWWLALVALGLPAVLRQRRTQ